MIAERIESREYKRQHVMQDGRTVTLERRDAFPETAPTISNAAFLRIIPQENRTSEFFSV